MMIANDWLTPSEAGAILGVGPDRVTQLVRQGVLPARRTPGKHVRARRDKVEELAQEMDEAPAQEHSDPEPAQDETLAPREPPRPPPRPKWQDESPWGRRVHEAEADFKVEQVEDQRAQLHSVRKERRRRQERAEAQEAAQAAEAERLRKLKGRALSMVPFLAPNDVRATVARQLERAVTTERYPADLAPQHVDPLLRSDVEHFLGRWRQSEAAKERQASEARQRKSMIDSALLHASSRTPRDWDWETQQDFERAVRLALKQELQPGMDQDEADEIAFGVLGEWLADAGEDEDDEYEDDDEAEYEDEDDDEYDDDDD